MKIQNYEANYLLPTPIISSYKFFGALFGAIHCMFHHCGSLDLETSSQSFFFIYLFIHFCQLNVILDKINKQCDAYSLYSYYNFIKGTCSVCAGFHWYLLILTLTCVKEHHFLLLFLKIVFHWNEGLFQTPIRFFGTSQCSTSHISFPLVLISLKIMNPCI